MTCVASSCYTAVLKPSSGDYNNVKYKQSTHVITVSSIQQTPGSLRAVPRISCVWLGSMQLHVILLFWTQAQVPTTMLNTSRVHMSSQSAVSSRLQGASGLLHAFHVYGLEVCSSMLDTATNDRAGAIHWETWCIFN